MPVFEYTGLTEAGKNVRGIRDAESSRVLRQILRKDGVYLTDARAAEAGAVAGEQKTGLSREVDLGAMLGFTGVSTQDLAIATRQLATLIAAGIPLVDALTALVDQIEQPRLKRIMGVVKQKVNEGASLADALREHPKVFSELYVNMIRAGESSGALDVVLVRLADFTESQAQLRNKIIVSNPLRADVIDKARDAIREGESIAAPLRRSGQFPPLVYHMIAIGERSGQLEEMLQNVARSYEAQVEMRVGALTSLLEPVMIVAMGGGVAFIVFSILMPIMQLNTFVPK